MIYLTEVILRLRDWCPIFERRVGGTASFETATSMNADIPVPHAFVIPGGDVAERAVGNATAQQITETFMVMVCVDNRLQREDGLGVTAADTVENIRRELFTALMGWEPVQWAVNPPPSMPEEFADIMPNSRADWFRYVGGAHADMNTGRLWHAFEFSATYYDGPTLPDTHKCQTNVTVSDGASNLYTGACTGDETTKVLTVLGSDGTRYPPGSLVVDTESGDIETNLPDGDYTVIWVYEPTYSVPTKVYAQYYPYLLSLAGGDPAAITEEMYDLVSEMPVDGTLISYVKANPPVYDPQWVFGKTRYVKELYEPPEE